MTFDSPLRSIIIEDEIGPLEDIKKALAESGNFTVVGSCDSVKDGLILIQNTPCDVLFLDIKIKGGYALDLIKILIEMDVYIPPVVITTGFIDYAMCRKLINDFNDYIIYILNKPFWEDWISNRERIIDKVFLNQQKHRMMVTKSYAFPVKQLQIRNGTQILFLNPADIVMVRVPEVPGLGTSEIVLEKSVLPISLSLSQVSVQLPDYFVQINRGRIINLSLIAAVNQNEITMKNGAQVFVGTAYQDSLAQLLGRKP